MKRREILAGAAAAAGAALVTRAQAQVQAQALGPVSVPASLPAPVSAAAPVPAGASGVTFYQRRVLDIAARERTRLAAHLWRNDLVAVADFALPSSLPRLHFANLENGSIRSFLVAHGRGSDPEHDGWLNSFSNEVGSEATSRGGFLSCEWYSGKYGTSIRLVGLDGDNSHALDRAIVIHPAWYVGSAMIDKWGKIGRSEGCFAMAQTDFNEALWHLSGGRLLYADRIGAV